VLNSAFFVLTGSLVLALIFTASVREFALRYGLVAQPQKDRWHKTPTALHGGVGIFFAYLCPLLFFIGEYPTLQILLFGAFLIFGVGLVDDFFHLQPYTKLIGQIVIACVFVAGGQFLGFFDWSILTFTLALIWIVGVTNAFNLLDNMDGLSAGTACIAAFCLMLAGVSTNNGLMVLSCAGLVGATLGFLWFNFSPAKIFMGDSGSLFLGFVLSTLAVTGQWGNVTNVIFALLIPVLVLAIPIFDTAFVSLVRFFNGRPISQGGRDHTSHRLVAFGLPERTTVLLFYVMSMICGVLAVVGLQSDWLYPFILAAIIVIGLLYLGIFLSGIVSYGDQANGFQGKSPNLILNLFILEKKRIGEVFLDAILIGLSFTIGFLIRFDGLPLPYDHVVAQSLPLLIAIKLAVFYYFGLYRGIWQYVGIKDLLNIVKAVTLSSLISVVVVTMVFRFENYSRAVFFIDWMVLLLGVSGVRVAIRVIKEFLGDWVMKTGKRLLIVGAGDAGEVALREIRNNQQFAYAPIGFIDDNPEKVGRRIHGIPVLGNREILNEVIGKWQIEEILIAIPSAQPQRLGKIIKECQETGLGVRVMPKLQRMGRQMNVPWSAPSTQLEENSLSSELEITPKVLK
jgi:UDP-GlcNAc:undecaprenyl-phosphate/decaprenyl-phosphate GlcNAc-1-phosphate transferase